jgi:sugar transferase EpsL
MSRPSHSLMLNHFYRRFGKRMNDLAFAIATLVVLSPLILLTALVVRISMGKGIFYRDERGGLDGRTFKLWKFRTMLNTCDAQGALLADQQRLTRTGQTLRKLSLDELPQLFNIVRGDISIVGPRPLLARYLPRYTPEQARRHEVLPGITGWAQINGRNNISWEDKFRLDVWYVDHVGFWLDLKIFFLTLWKVLRRSDISASGHATMPEFMASDRQHS